MSRDKAMGWHQEVAEQGFAIVSDVFSESRVNRLIESINRWSPQRSRAGVRHAHQLDCVLEAMRDSALLGVARDVLGQTAFPFHATLFEKSPASNWLVVWHQDTALPLRERADVAGWGPWSVKEGINYAHAPASALSRVLALRIHLDDSTADNGPLRVLPRTHTLGVLTDDRIHELAQSIPAVDCICPKGGIVAMKPLLVHASSKSHTENPRRVLHIEYAESNSIAHPLELAVPTT